MSQQQLQQQPQTQQLGQEFQQGFEQSVPLEVSNAVYALEQIETDAEWAKAQAIQQGDSFTATQLEDLADLAHVQKKLLLRQSPQAQTISQCVERGIQQATQQLQQSQIPGVQQVTQQAQQAAQMISQASMQVQQLGGQVQGSVQTQLGGQQPIQQY